MCWVVVTLNFAKNTVCLICWFHILGWHLAFLETLTPLIQQTGLLTIHPRLILLVMSENPYLDVPRS